MNSLGTLSSILGLAFASGINLYAAVLVTGLGIRFGWITGIPGDLNVLANPIILGIAGLMYLLEFFADKIPYVSVVWDSIHTVIRPLGGAALALASAAHLSPEAQVLATLAGGSIALGTHSTKMGYRLIAHASPEPVSDSIFSLAEDFGVVGLVLLTYQHPAIAIGVVVALLAAMAILLPMIVRILRFVSHGVIARIASWFSSRQKEAPPEWLARELNGPCEVYRCFARSIPKSPRMQPGYLVFVDGRQLFASRGWIRTRVAPVDFSNLTVSPGVLFDVISAGRCSIYMTKDCALPAGRQIQQL
jgi:hypothetical protein